MATYCAIAAMQLRSSSAPTLPGSRRGPVIPRPALRGYLVQEVHIEYCRRRDYCWFYSLESKACSRMQGLLHGLVAKVFPGAAFHSVGGSRPCNGKCGCFSSDPDLGNMCLYDSAVQLTCC